MSNDKTRTERLFTLYSDNLSACHPEYEGIFVCPMCLEIFDRSSLSDKTVTLEHIIPSGRGADNQTLTCKKCNNTTGSKMDADLLKRIRLEENMAKDGGPVRCEIITGEGRHNGQLFVKMGDPPTIEIIGLPDQSNPRLLQKAVEEFPVVESFTLNWSEGYVHIRSQTAMLRSAYLTMFRYFGYSYILHPALNRVREQIEEPIVKEEDGDGKVRHEAILRGVKTIPQSCLRTFVTLVNVPTQMRSFMVHLGLSQELSYSYAVMLPGPEDGADAVYDRIEAEGSMNFTILDYTPIIVSDAAHKDAVHWLWQFAKRI